MERIGTPKKRLQTLSVREIAYSRFIYMYRIITLFCLVHVVVYNESLCDGCYASQYHKSDNHHNLFPFLSFINVVFSYLCPSFHLALCLATAYFMKFTLLLTSHASTTAKQQTATTNTIIIIVTLSFLSNLIFSSPYWSSFFDYTAKVVPFVFAHKQKNNYFSFVIIFIDIRQ